MFAIFSLFLMFSGLDECASRRVKGTIVLLLSFFFVFLVRFMASKG